MIKHIKGRIVGNVLLTVFILISACGVAFLSLGDKNEVVANGEISDASSAFELPTVVIDPGHGGADCGAVGINAVLEKDINLKLSLLLAKEFEKAGYKVILTRTEDVMLVDEDGKHSTNKSSDLTARTKIAEEGQIFISIHMNKFPEQRYKGAQVYYSVNDERSVKLAEMIQTGVKNALQQDNNRNVKSGEGLYLLDRIKCPSVIVECGFLSNAEDTESLTSDEYQSDLAFEIFSAVDDFVIDCMDNDT